MSADAWCLLALVLVLFLAGAALFRFEHRLKDDALAQRNNHAQVVYKGAGLRWYPHVMDDQSVRWYDVDHDTVDLRRPTVR